VNGFILWVAQGFGVGQIPIARGMFGSLVGLLWFIALLMPGNLWVFAGGVIAGLILSVWVCGEAERILQRNDPVSVVLDEISAMPVCFIAWIGILFFQDGHLPAPDRFFSGVTWPLTGAVFIAFRLFDVLKPWPVRQIEDLHGGLGITLDDLLAAVYVNVLVLLIYAGMALFSWWPDFRRGGV
jgi:phosphatidylglycerophosphatase A